MSDYRQRSGANLHGAEELQSNYRRRQTMKDTNMRKMKHSPRIDWEFMETKSTTLHNGSQSNAATELFPGRKTVLSLFKRLLCVAPIALTALGAQSATNSHSAIPWNQIGAKAGADYKDDGVAVTPTESGASLRCVFQRLDGEATTEGLWLTSTVADTTSDRFRVKAMAFGRKTLIPLPDAGEVAVCGQTARLSRPGLTEEYSVSMDGVRQDFVVEEAPASPADGELIVKLSVTGAQVEPAPNGARLRLENSGRNIAYSRLRATDATGKILPARMEADPEESEAAGNFFEALSMPSFGETKVELTVLVDDAGAVYPLRIDPTFSDANWVGMGGVPGVNGQVNAAVIDASGNLYIGGEFTIAGNVFANNIAEWNGTNWSALGSGLVGSSAYVMPVNALAVSGGTLYAGGGFTNAGGKAANYIAQWMGSNWSPLGSGMSGFAGYQGVYSLAVVSNALYAGGDFTRAGSSPANYIAKWDGIGWSALGSGTYGSVYALAWSGQTLYAGGDFTSVGGNYSAVGIAQWNGSSWSALGSGLSVVGYGVGGSASALAVSDGMLYVGGYFTAAGGILATNIAEWDGTNWSALGLGISGAGEGYGPYVSALAVSGNTLYMGGNFTTAGGNPANGIAQWDGSSWSPLGLGFSYYTYQPNVYALAVSGTNLFAGGSFATAGVTPANNIAQWNGSSWSSPTSEFGYNIHS
jgi:hypothetical protein